MPKEETTIYKKLLECQKELGAVKKDKENPFFHSNYADVNAYLEVVKPILSKNGIVIIQPLNGNNLQTILIDAETGEKIDSEVSLPVNPDPQKQGSIITYFRRYAIQSLLALQAEDDDGQKGSSSKNEMPDRKPTAKQIEYLYKLLKDKGAKDKSDSLRIMSEMADTLITDIGELTMDQASKMIEQLKAAAEDKTIPVIEE